MVGLFVLEATRRDNVELLEQKKKRGGGCSHDARRRQESTHGGALGFCFHAFAFFPERRVVLAGVCPHIPQIDAQSG